MKKTMKADLVFTLLFLLSFIHAIGQRQMENLNRGVVAVRTSSSQVFVSWRMLGTEYNQNATYNLYRGSTQIASNLATTNYVDNTSSPATYSVGLVVDGKEDSRSEAVSIWTNNYLNISLSPPSSNHHASDCSVGDLDGDGEYDIVLKWEANNYKDNSLKGTTDVVYLDGIKLDGTRLWRINLGKNIRAGAHYTQFMVYDLDGDGIAEVACKTAPGTKAGTGKYLSMGSASGDDDNADYRNSDGYVLSGPEYLTVFSGKTGAELTTIDYIPARGKVLDWGDSYGNRVDRFLACIAYCDGQKPSLVMCRGYYTRSVLVAWDFRNGKLSHRWTFDTNNGYSSYAGQGNHSISVADVDGDSRDEIIYGAMAVDDDGRGLWNSGLKHGDAMHVSDIDPSRPGLERWGIHETSNTPGSALLDARTGAVIWKTSNADVGRGVAADLTSDPGMECWGGTSGLRTATNGSAGSKPASTNHLIWWDGDEYRELLDDISITKYGGGTLLKADGCSSNNSTKKNPNLTVDIFGDWREEAIWRTSDNQNLRIYTTTTSTIRKMYTLMHDPVYRLGIAWQNVAYNQPPHTGFFLGHGMASPPNPNIYLIGETNPGIIPVTGVSVSPATATVAVGSKVNLSATVSPGNASNKAVSWSSSHTDVATINSGGVVKGISEGSAIITVTTADGNKTATSAITVSGGSTSMPCENPVSISIPFTQDGVGEFCWVTTDEIAYVNSWNMTELTINGADYTNKWSDDLPTSVNGEWVIYYRSEVAWAHFEAPGLKNATMETEQSERHSAFDIKVYPNPAHSVLTIEFGHELTEEAWIQLFDSTGRLIKTCKAQGTQQNINMDSLPSGLYMVKVSNSTENIVKRILKK